MSFHDAGVHAAPNADCFNSYDYYYYYHYLIFYAFRCQFLSSDLAGGRLPSATWVETQDATPDPEPRQHRCKAASMMRPAQHMYLLTDCPSTVRGAESSRTRALFQRRHTATCLYECARGQAVLSTVHATLPFLLFSSSPKF